MLASRKWLSLNYVLHLRPLLPLIHTLRRESVFSFISAHTCVYDWSHSSGKHAALSLLHQEASCRRLSRGGRGVCHTAVGSETGSHDCRLSGPTTHTCQPRGGERSEKWTRNNSGGEQRVDLGFSPTGSGGEGKIGRRTEDILVEAWCDGNTRDGWQRCRASENKTDWQAVARKNRRGVIKAGGKTSVLYSQNLTLWHALFSSLIGTHRDSDIAAWSFIQLSMCICGCISTITGHGPFVYTN